MDCAEGDDDDCEEEEESEDSDMDDGTCLIMKEAFSDVGTPRSDFSIDDTLDEV